MIRQAGQVCRACAAFTRRVPWPLGARVAALPPRHSRALHSPPGAAASAEAIQSGHASRSAQEAHPGPSPGSETAKPPNHPDPSQQPEEAHEAREGLGEQTESDGSKIDPPTSQSKFPTDRMTFHMSSIALRHKTTGKDFRLLKEQFRDWDEDVKAIFDRLDGCRRDSPRVTKPASMEALEKLLAFETIEDMRSSWLSTHWEERDRRWPHMMRAAMNFRPESAALVLEATVEPPDTPTWAVVDVFAFAVHWSSKLPPDRRASHQAQLPKLLLHLLRSSRPRHYQFRQWAIGRTVAVCDPDTAAEVYSALQEYNHPLHFNTRLHIASRLAKGSKYRLAALQLFEELLKDPKVDNTERRLAALATELFTLPPSWKKGRGSPVDVQLLAEAFERAVGLGFSPNLVTYTAMIRALCVTNQLDTAWRIYDALRKQGTTPDPHVFSILLNGAKRAVSLNSTIRVFEEATPDALRVPYLWNDLMHIILVAATEEAKMTEADFPVPIPAFPSMLQVYAKFFKLKPLQTLLPLDLQRSLDHPADALEDLNWKATLALLLDELPVSPPDKLVEPGMDTLGIMLLGYVKSFYTSRPVLEFYSHFRALLKNRDPVAVSLASHSTLPYDAIILSLTENVGMLSVAADIVDTMLKDAADSAAALQRHPPEPEPILSPTTATPATTTTTTTTTSQKFTHPPPFHHPPPSVYTWSILIRSFGRARSGRGAAQIIDVMRRHGVEPNSVTWHTLLSGFARHQDTPRVMAVLNQLDEERIPPNRYTIRAVSRLSSPDRLLERLEERAVAREDERWRMVEDAAALLGPRAPEPSETPQERDTQTITMELDLAPQPPSSLSEAPAPRPPLPTKEEEAGACPDPLRIEEETGPCPDPTRQARLAFWCRDKEKKEGNAALEQARLNRAKQQARAEEKRAARQQAAIERANRERSAHYKLVWAAARAKGVKKPGDGVFSSRALDDRMQRLDQYRRAREEREQLGRAEMERARKERAEKEAQAAAAAAEKAAQDSAPDKELDSYLRMYDRMVLALKPRAPKVSSKVSSVKRGGGKAVRPVRSARLQHQRSATYSKRTLQGLGLGLASTRTSPAADVEEAGTSTPPPAQE